MSKKKIKSDFRKIIISIILVIGIFIYTTYLEEPINNFLKQKDNITQPVNSTRKVEGDLSVYFVDVGQADCILINNKGQYMLIDAGNNEDGEKLVQYFKDLGINKFNYVIGTHAHEDHIGGMDNIINNFEIGTFYMPDVVTTTKTFEDVLDALENKNLSFETPEIDSSFSLSDAEVEVLYVGDESNDLNDTSIILKLIYQNNSFLFTGDASSKVEKQILNKNIKSDVLKVGHHGSQYSSSESFLKKVNPKYSIIQVGIGNTYDHPKDIILSRLDKINSSVYRTDQYGTIIAKSDGNNISITKLETDTNG